MSEQSADGICQNCGDEIPDEDDAVYGSGGMKESGLKQLMAGEYAERRHDPTATYRLVRDPRHD